MHKVPIKLELISPSVFNMSKITRAWLDVLYTGVINDLRWWKPVSDSHT